MKVPSSQLLEGVDVMAAVVDSLSFGGAAERLDMSQSGVSRAISRLETRLGIRLFERTTRAVRLTEQGREYYEQVMPLVAALAEVNSQAAGNSQRISGRLRVNIDPLFASQVLGPQLGTFMDAHPALEIELRSRDELGDIISDGFDLALRFGYPQSSSLIAQKLFDTQVFAMAAPAYLQRFGHPASPEDLEHSPHRCIMYREPITGRPFSWQFYQGKRKLLIQPQGLLTVNDAETAFSTCLAGLGVAQIFALGSEEYVASGRLVPLFPAWPDHLFPLYAYYPSRHHVPAKTRALLAFVRGLVR